MKYFTYLKPYDEPKNHIEAWINNLSKTIYKGIYESHGLIEFDNKEYRNTIKNICLNLYNKLDLTYNISEIPLVHFFKYTLTEDDLNLSWLKLLDIYICNESFECTDEQDILKYENIIEGNSLVFDENYPGYYKEDKKHNVIEHATIILITSFKDIDYKSILLHEITHLFDNIKLHYNKKDILYSLTNSSNMNINDIVKYRHESQIIFMNINELYKVIIYIMYYCNASESHAFRENMYGEIYDTILSNNFNNIMNSFMFVVKGDRTMKNNKERLNYFILNSGNETYNLYMCFMIIKNLLKYLTESLKQEFDTFYSKDIKNIYDKFSTLNKLLQYYYKTLKKALSHNRILLKTILEGNKNHIKEEYYNYLMNLIDNN